MPATAKTYTIREAAKISGLPESTLRYYEKIGLMEPVSRDASSKNRVYAEDDINRVVAIACLNATELSIESMRQYLKNRDLGPQGAHNQVKLLEPQEKHLEDEIRYMQLRLKYVKSKIEYWKAVEAGNEKRIEASRQITYAITREMKLPSFAQTSK